MVSKETLEKWCDLLPTSQEELILLWNLKKYGSVWCQRKYNILLDLILEIKTTYIDFYLILPSKYEKITLFEWLSQNFKEDAPEVWAMLINANRGELPQQLERQSITAELGLNKKSL